ncbi:MAG TPA: radical SAM protein, partial [Ignavibacteriaceae bacterium]|nr:radical SAM protein [Ignavibacteriaceae bacterium]
QYYYAKLILDEIKLRNLGKTILGGTHASLLPNQCLNDGFDFVVKGYGETALLNIVNGNVSNGIIQGEFIRNLDELPFPAWEDLFASNYEISYGDNVAHFFSMRGCPYTCSYCATGEIYGLKVGFRSVENVIAEIIYLKEKFGIERVYFLDPTFTVNKERAIRLSKALTDLDITWTCETRVDCIDEVTLHSLAKSGCDLISFGIETGSDSVHSNLGKQTSIEQNIFAIKLAHDVGLKVKAFLMSALPDDNWETLEIFQNFISKNKPDNWLFSTFIPFPGTEQWNNPEKYGIKIECDDFRAYYNLGLNARAPVNISNKYLSRRELVSLRNQMLEFLRVEVPNPRVEKAISDFAIHKPRLQNYINGLDEEFLY